MSMPKYYYLFILSCLSLPVWAEEMSAENPNNTQEKSSTAIQPWLDKVPETIDSLPTVLPQESDARIVPATEDSKENTWWDKKQAAFSNKLQDYAAHMNDWFGKPDPDDPASANLRIIIDNDWNKYDKYSAHPRVRGKVKLPTLENRFSLVFGDDTLDDEMHNRASLNNENIRDDNNRTLDRQRTRDDNASLALRWSNLSKSLGIDTDADIGIRSGDDLYLRLKGEKGWELDNNFYTNAEQIYRYGIDSKHYLRTNLEVRHARPNEAFIADQLSLTYTDDGTQNFSWDNRLFRQHQFFHHHWFNYGIYMGGEIDNNTPDLDSYGPFVAWRQPVWREWLFVQSEVNYYNQRKQDRDHTIGALIRLETWF